MNATTLSMIEEAGNAISADSNRACSNGKSEENKYSDVMPSTERGVAQRNLYAIKIDRGRNCYTCGRFRYMA